MNISVEEALQLLKLEKPVTDYDIKKAYRKAAFQYHPDRNNDGRYDYFNKIRHAYKLLQHISAASINQGLYKKQRRAVTIPDTLLYTDIENIFYLYHTIKKWPLLKWIFSTINSHKEQRNLLNYFFYLFISLFFVIVLAPAFLGAFILLSLPYLLYVFIFESVSKFHHSKTGHKLRKTAIHAGTLKLYIAMRGIPALIVLVWILCFLQLGFTHFPGIILYYFTGVVLLIYSIWSYSISVDIFTALKKII